MLPLVDGCVDCVVTSPPYWGLRDYGVEASVWGGDSSCVHQWGDPIAVNATNHTDKRRWNHTRNGRDEEQPVEKRVAWLRTFVQQGCICAACGAWLGKLGLEPSPDLFVENVVQVFREVRRVLKDGGVLWLNIGDSYRSSGGNTRQHGPNASCRNTLAGLTPRSGGPREHQDGLKVKDLVGIPWRVAFALQADGWYLRSDIIWSKPNPMPESVTDRPTKAHEYLFLLTKSEKYWYDAAAIAEPVSAAMLMEMEQGYDGLGLKDYEGAGVQNPSSVKARIIANAKLRALERFDRGEVGAPSQMSSIVSETGDRYMSGRVRAKHLMQQKNAAGRRLVENTADARAAGADHEAGVGNGVTRNKRTVWTIPTMPYSGAHFATMPEKLVEPCILAGCKLGGLVLDPFCGSGTVIAVAERLGRRGVGVDLSYQQLAKERTAQRGLRFGELTDASCGVPRP